MDNSYGLLRHAVLNKKPISAIYDGASRQFCPHALGRKDMRPHVMTYQFGGTDSKGQPVSQWRCFDVAKLRNVRVEDGLWRTAPDHTEKNTCLTWVDVQVR